ncbi:hypothetical protein ABZT16_00585 [Streptomyces flaveolus]|uniref:Uncharacterized protein n=1 Tax=Streptomyces flaveolus TaxID=67297 RepID=A0ABV3A1Z3_9ACTN
MSAEDADRKKLAEFSHVHADHRIKTHVNEFDRVDAILALKRAMQTRIDHLDSLYGFKQYPDFQQLGPLGLLEQWGVIRKRMLHRMRQLRNAVEHDGAEPPSLEDCEDYAEVTWWFLRGTSPLLQPMEEVEFGGAFDGAITYSYKPFRIEISGTVKASLISQTEQSGWAKLKTEVATYGDAKGKMTPAKEGNGRYHLQAFVAEAGTAHALLQHAFRELM